jgi:hypothetical protein
MAPDLAETTQIEEPPRGREEVPAHLSRFGGARTSSLFAKPGKQLRVAPPT